MLVGILIVCVTIDAVGMEEEKRGEERGGGREGRGGVCVAMLTHPAPCSARCVMFQVVGGVQPLPPFPRAGSAVVWFCARVCMVFVYVCAPVLLFGQSVS